MEVCERKKVVVFGGAGFLGSHVADRLSARGHGVTIFDNRPNQWLQDDQRQVFGSICDAERVRFAVTGADAVVNCAAVAHVNVARHEPRRTMEVNVMGHLTVLECSEAAGVGQIIYASSMYALSRVGSFYRVSKVAAEELTELFAAKAGMAFTIARLGSLYGERTDSRNPNTVYRLVREAIETGEMHYEGRADDRREYLNVKDAAEIMAAAVNDPEMQNRHLILTGQERVSIGELMTMIREVLGREIRIVTTDTDYDDHYKTTPYAFIPREGQKVVASSFTDLGAGILATIREITATHKRGIDGPAQVS